MNQCLFDFYSVCGVDNKKRKFTDIINFSDQQLESSHDIVQWLFPLNEPSQFNYSAPLLDQETIDAIISSYICICNLHLAVERFLDFFNNNVHWLTLENHNYLRITRMIKCCILLGEEILASDIYNTAKLYYQFYRDMIGEITLKFWEDAFNMKE